MLQRATLWASGPAHATRDFATIVPFGLNFFVSCTLACAISGELTGSQQVAMGDFFSGVLERDIDLEALRLATHPSSQTVRADPLVPSILFHVSCKVPKAGGGNNAGDYGWAEKQRPSQFTRTWTALVAVHLITQRCHRRRIRTMHGLKILKLRPRRAVPTCTSVELTERGCERSKFIVALFLILKYCACHCEKLQQR